MDPLILILILAVLAPFAWLASEFQSRVWLRIVFGIAALVGVYFIGSLLDAVRGFGSNTYFSSANQQLIQATIKGLDRGQADDVLRELRAFDQSYEPTYENRAGYQEKVEAYSQKLEGLRSNAGD
jgi:hypothetical protein